jgi:tetratricopeptide (TPR) repeat protein
VLLEANPLASVENLKGVRGTMARGRWYPREELQRLRDSIAARNAQVHPLVVLLDSLAMKAADGPAAVALYQRIRSTWPDVVPVFELVLRGYGRNLFLKGDKQKAIQFREITEQLYSRSHSAANEVGRGYLFAGDTTKALEHFRRSLELSPHNSAVRRMADKLEDSRRPLRFSPAGRYEFEPVTIKKPTPSSLVLTVADSVGKWKGTLLWDGKEVPLDELVVGGDAIWATVDINDQTLELKLRVSGEGVSGVWTYGWGNNGEISGVRKGGA